MAQYQGKHGQNSPRRSPLRRRALLLCAVLLLVVSVGGTLAYITVQSERLNNTFTPGYVTSRVNASGHVRSVTNTGNVDAYIRAAVTVNWVVAGDGNTTYGLRPVENTDYTIALDVGADGHWVAHTDGYYYYKHRVAPGGTTQPLVTDITTLSTAETPEGYTLAVEVAAEAIQADGDTDVGRVPAYRDAWGTAVPTPVD